MVKYQDMTNNDERYASFWKWFQDTEKSLFSFEDTADMLLPQILLELQKIHEELVFEVGPKIDGVREFVISANGAKTAFSYVIELAQSSPEFERWDIIPFRQRKDIFDMEIEIGDTVLVPQDIQFSFEKEKERIHLTIYVDGLDIEDEQTYHLVFLLLDNIIGEYDVEMKIGDIDVLDAEDMDEDESVFPLTRLPHVVDSLTPYAVH